MTADPLLEEIWTDVQQRKASAVGDDEHAAVLLSDHLKHGYTTDEASQMREAVHSDAFNVVPPPVDCPAWLCIILPCINHLKSMKAHKNCVPDDAEVLRNGKWIRYDAASLVLGDVIRLEEGDVVPADCVVACEENQDVVLVDLRIINGQSRPKQVNSSDSHSKSKKQRSLLYGGTVVQGRATALVTAIGTDTVLGQLIKTGKFPVPETDGIDDDEDETTSMMESESANMRAMEMGTMS